MFYWICFSAVIISTSYANYDCPRGKKITIPDTTFLFPFRPFSFAIDNSQYDGDNYVEQAINGVVTINDNPQYSAAIYIHRTDPEYFFRVMYLDFTVGNVDTMTIYFYHTMTNHQETKFVLNNFPFSSGFSSTHNVRIYNQGGNSKSGALSYDFLPEKGLPNVHHILILYTRRDPSSNVMFGNLFLAACTYPGGYNGMRGPHTDMIALAPGSSGQGKKIPKLVTPIAAWIDNYAANNEDVVARLLVSAVRNIERKSKVFKTNDPQYIYAGMPTENNAYTTTTTWLRQNNPKVQKMVQQIRNLVPLLDDAAVGYGLSKASQKKLNKLITKLLSGLAKVDQNIVSVGNEYLKLTPVSTDFDITQDWCESRSDCLRPVHICCYCKCRTRQECNYIGGQISLRKCLGNNLDLAIAGTKQAQASLFDGLCFVADEVGGKVGDFLNDLKLYAYFDSLLDGIPNSNESIPGRPQLTILVEFTNWQIDINKKIQAMLDESRKGLRELRKYLMKKNRAGVDREDLVFGKMAALLRSYDVVDQAVTNSTVCYMNYLLDAYPFPLPE